ncbi:zinc ABC transporter substrate-binding protein AztC [Nocardioides sp. C4-1]|uniref:zinc ABC transporter substrate-binding protein AztC n=1 Tax=Nocardioides sp. C4-1 TaxID=3151851 RepID=UPI003266E1DB
MRALLAVGLVVAGLTACAADADDRPVVVVSTNILGDVVEQVAGDEAEVVTLMKPDADPHSFEVSAREAGRMRGADLLVSNGLGLEEGLQQHLDAAADEGVTTFVAGDVVDVLDYADGDAAGTPDPHFWTDPARMVDVVEGLEAALLGIDGVDAEAVREQAGAYLEQVRAVDDELTAAFAAIPDEQRALVTNHHVFGYLAERYDFEVVGAVVPGGTTLAAPSASDLASLAEAIRETGVRAVFAESSSRDRLVQALAEESGLEVDVLELYTESLTAPGGGAEDYLTMMRVNAERIATGLS